MSADPEHTQKSPPRRNIFVALALITNSLSLIVIIASCSAPPPPASAPSVTRTANLLFIGDVMSHDPQVVAAEAAAREQNLPETTGRVVYDYTEVFQHFSPGFKAADVVVANLETTLRTSPPYTGYPSFAAPAELAFALRSAGVDIATVANNHICDKGAGGIRATLALLDSAGIRHTGAFLDSADRRARHPLRFTAGGLRFALFAYTYGTNGLPVPGGMIVNLIDSAALIRDLSPLASARAADRAPGFPVRDEGVAFLSEATGRAESAERSSAATMGAVVTTGGVVMPTSPEITIVSFHWGEEYRSGPTPSQRRFAALARSLGADLIIGSHPHVVGPVETHFAADSVVVGATYYSLGNFVSNQRRPGTDGGIVADITVSQTDSLPVHYSATWHPAWVHTFWRNGVRRYTVLPASSIDTLSASNPSFAPAKRFLISTRRLLGH